MTLSPIPTAELLGITFSTPMPDQAVKLILGHNRSGYVCLANVHVTMEAQDEAVFASILAGAWLVLPDGKPVAFALRRLGFQARQVRGPTLAEDICAEAAQTGIPIGLYGGRPEAITRLQELLPQRHPGIKIVYAWSPPFRALSQEEQAKELAAISASGARVLLVGLGCPKQERWMSQHYAALPMPLVGVGAWFDFSSGMVREAPVWMRHVGLEWFHRFCQQPGRLWRRYALHNPRFCLLVGTAWLRYIVGLKRIRGPTT